MHLKIILYNMQPSFMYWNDAKFIGDSNFKKFTLKFNDSDKLNGVIFKKDMDYFITSLSANVKLIKDIKNLNDFKKIEEVSKKANEILKNGNDHFHEDIILEADLDGVDDLLPNKKKRKLSIKSLDFFDEKSKKKKNVSIYSQYKELKFFGLKFEKENGNIYKYEIKLLEERENLFLVKRLFYDKNKLIELVKKKFNYKNTFFIENNGKLIGQTINFTDFLVMLIENLKGSNIDFLDLMKNTSNFQSYFYQILFGGTTLATTVLKPNIFKKGNYSNLTDLNPIAVNFNGNIFIKGGVNFYITEELYKKKQSIFKKIPEITPKNLTDADLKNIRIELNDNSFKATKLFGFRNTKAYSRYPILSANDFIIPDFNVKIKIKKKGVSDDLRKIFEGSFFILDNDYNTSKKTEVLDGSKRSAEIKNSTDEKMEENLNSEYIKLKKLAKEIKIEAFNQIYENFFLYDLENMIRPSFTTELQTEFSIYGLVNFSGKVNEEKKLKAVSPKNYLTFDVLKDTYKNNLNLELTKVHTKKTFEITGDKVYNIGILAVEKRKHVGQKRSIMPEIIDKIIIIGIQNSGYSYLNPVNIQIKSESIRKRLLLKKNNKYKFVLKSLIFSSNVTNDTDSIFLISNGLNDAKKVFVGGKLEDVIGICYLSEIDDWEIIKGQTKRVQTVFVESENFYGQSSHIALPFKTNNISDILNFSVTLVDGEGNKINFKEGETQLPLINFEIQILK